MIYPLLIINLLPVVVNACLLEDGRSAVYLSVFEDLPPGSKVGHLPIRGNLTGSSNNVHLRLVKGSDFVEFAPGTKDLILKKPLDREKGSPNLEALVECRMDNETSDFSKLNISVLIIVKDVNDNAPQFDASEYAATVKEELPVGTIVFVDFEAVDADQSGPNSLVHYSIVDGGDFGEDLLEIKDPQRAIVTVKKRMNYESPLHSFTVQLEARDNGEPVQRTRVPLKITVEDVDDLPPVFSSEFHRADAVKDGILLVDQPIKAVDGDALNASVDYQLLGDHAGLFSIDIDGIVRVSGEEPTSPMDLLVKAVQTDNAERSALAALHVSFLPALRFEHDTYAAKVYTNTPKHSILTTVLAASSNENPSIRYSLLEDNGLISIDESNGTVYLVKELGRKGTAIPATAAFTVLATDGGETARARLSLSFSADLACAGGIRFEHDTYEMDIGGHPFVGEVALTPRSQPAVIQLLNMNSYFTIDNAGRLSSSAGISPPCELCELLVAATDKQGRVAFTKIIVHNASPAFSLTGLLSLVLLVLVLLLIGLLVFFICKRISYAYVINDEKKAAGSPSPKCMHTPPTTVTDSPLSRGEPGNRLQAPKSPARTAGAAHLVPVTTVTSSDGAPTVYF